MSPASLGCAPRTGTCSFTSIACCTSSKNQRRYFDRRFCFRCSSRSSASGEFGQRPRIALRDQSSAHAKRTLSGKLDECVAGSPVVRHVGFFFWTYPISSVDVRVAEQELERRILFPHLLRHTVLDRF